MRETDTNTHWDFFKLLSFSLELTLYSFISQGIWENERVLHKIPAIELTQISQAELGQKQALRSHMTPSKNSLLCCMTQTHFIYAFSLTLSSTSSILWWTNKHISLKKYTDWAILGHVTQNLEFTSWTTSFAPLWACIGTVFSPLCDMAPRS